MKILPIDSLQPTLALLGRLRSGDTMKLEEVIVKMKSIYGICYFFSLLITLILVRQIDAADLPSAQNGVAVMSQIVINEFLALNDSLNADEDGDYSDWVEPCKSGDATINLIGVLLSDDPNNLNQWTFPTVAIASHVYLLIWAFDKKITPANINLTEMSTSGE